MTEVKIQKDGICYSTFSALNAYEIYTGLRDATVSLAELNGRDKWNSDITGAEVLVNGKRHSHFSTMPDYRNIMKFLGDLEIHINKEKNGTLAECYDALASWGN